MTVTLGYATTGGNDHTLDEQLAELAAAGVDPKRIFTDQTSGSVDKMRAGLLALRSYARAGDVVVVVALDKLGRTAAEVAQIVTDLGARGITLRCVNNGLDTATATGRVVATVLAELAALDAAQHTGSTHRT
ncbi:recombinase family protein [Mycolicibacterium hippocampi]|uniref:Resolvase, N-terminal domain n=1 Tax=Mycolicibacterium hippocampi TaxID=659824 RepID=A0A850PLP8_9MYCO|nr:Resolvase, N-terminal domain [Mycolicibacterium hippocampi]